MQMIEQPATNLVQLRPRSDFTQQPTAFRLELQVAADFADQSETRGEQDRGRLKLLLLDPHLPPWLPELTLHNLRVGTSTISIRFYRTDKGTSDYRILDTRGTLHVVRQPSPWSLTASFGERLRDVLVSLLPRR